MTAPRAPHGLFLGLCTVDLLYRVDRPLRPDDKVEAEELLRCLGGPALNAAVAFADRGGVATVLTVLSDDPLATATLQSDPGLDGVTIVRFGTSQRVPVSSIAVAESGERQVLSAARDLHYDAVAPACLPEGADAPDVVLLDGHHLDAALPLVRSLLDGLPDGTPVVADLGSWKDRTEDLLALTTHAVASSGFRPPGGEDDPLGWLADRVPFAAISDGPDDIRVRTRGTSMSVPVPAVDVRGTLGAGDFLHGALAWALASGLSDINALTLAAEVASRSCTVWDTRSWLERPLERRFERTEEDTRA
jgi:sugar/nucleoside kinase (ribokinase family)